MTACCPRCDTALDGGPVLFRCDTCKKSVYAADLRTECEVAAR
ncbi:hypothetical protein [Microtetraspora sp. AC03309]|nr:hypothetical protein [Microtetraspora sp. AC03309]